MWVVLGVDSRRRVQAFGTDTGKVFTSERSAERMRKRLEGAMPYESSQTDFIVLEIAEAPTGRR